MLTRSLTSIAEVQEAGCRVGQILDASAPPEVYQGSLKLCRAFNTMFVHANNLAGTAARYCNGRGKPTANPEIGGVYLGPQTEGGYLREALTGLRCIMGSLWNDL